MFDARPVDMGAISRLRSATNWFPITASRSTPSQRTGWSKRQRVASRGEKSSVAEAPLSVWRAPETSKIEKSCHPAQ